MENNEFKKACIKYRTCCYCDDIIKFGDFDFDNILIDEKTKWNLLVYDISCKTLVGSKPFRFRFDKNDGFIKVHNGSRCFVLFSLKKYDVIYNRIRYLLNLFF